ncbi:isoprenylcysteine carboxylmethyltransferase family protein [Endozoicomonas sp. G2_1]|uniref:methyltransferase family protein n=1 Tax=Endozoicomonas sp. G2_1 TaxID=2821091 RepID=UPI001ADD29E7|nr:isoprenylcysteine carboxylmethyltransferase family protein [Endozoicomonas sp. G2_1]MBO9491803.1 isoprenylcysteine carboxylmethyltransferase family protein [Endozoicomonas sp. G2_1]
MASSVFEYLQLKIPPLAVLVLFALVAYGLAYSLPYPWLEQSIAIVLAILLLCTGVLVALAGVLAFNQAKTTVNPTQPAQAKQLVITGVYKFTRNPMYLGFLLVLMAVCCYLNSLLALLACPLFVVYINVFQITPEEGVLRQKFSDFDDYCRQVRRWL